MKVGEGAGLALGAGAISLELSARWPKPGYLTAGALGDSRPRPFAVLGNKSKDKSGTCSA